MCDVLAPRAVVRFDPDRPALRWHPRSLLGNQVADASGAMRRQAESFEFETKEAQLDRRNEVMIVLPERQAVNCLFQLRSDEEDRAEPGTRRASDLQRQRNEEALTYTFARDLLEIEVLDQMDARLRPTLPHGS